MNAFVPLVPLANVHSIDFSFLVLFSATDLYANKFYRDLAPDLKTNKFLLVCPN